jgi:hypothetical protein
VPSRQLRVLKNFKAERLLSGVERSDRKKSKGCDIGYAPAAGSCEGVNHVDACTVTAFDVITAFTVSVPSLPLAEPAGFFGPESPANHFTRLITQSTSARSCLFQLTFRPSTHAILNEDRALSTPKSGAIARFFSNAKPAGKRVNIRVRRSANNFFRVMHRTFHNFALQKRKCLDGGIK